MFKLRPELTGCLHGVSWPDKSFSYLNEINILDKRQVNVVYYFVSVTYGKQIIQ